MEKALKQRLTGAVVLVVIGVIFVPLLLDGAGHNARFSRDVEIPPEPVIKIKSWEELKEIPANPAKSVTSTSRTRSETKVVPEPKPEKKPVVKPKKVTKPSIKAWALQLGSFKQQTNSLVLRDQLRAKGYRAFVDTTSSKGVTSYKVKIGPDLDRSKLEKIADKLEKQEKLKSIVITHP